MSAGILFFLIAAVLAVVLIGLIVFLVVRVRTQDKEESV